MAIIKIQDFLIWCTRCDRFCRCGQSDAVSEEELQPTASMPPFSIPPRRRSDYQGLDDTSEDGSYRSRSASAASSTSINPDLYDKLFKTNNDVVLNGPQYNDDQVKREHINSSHGTLTLTTKILDKKKLILRLCDLRRLPGKGPHNLRNYDVAAIVTLQKCNWESKAVPAKELVTRLNEELNLPYMPNEPLKITVYEWRKEKVQLEHINVLGYFQLSLNDGMDSDVKTLTHNGETLYTCQLNQSFVAVPVGQLLLSLCYDNSRFLTVVIMKTKGLLGCSIKVKLQSRGKKVKKDRVVGDGPIYSQSFRFIVPEEFLHSSSIVISFKSNNHSINALCRSGPWTVFSDGNLTHWGEMLECRKAIVQWRQVYPV